MRLFLFLLLGLIPIPLLFAQNIDPDTKVKKFKAGIDFLYIGTEMKYNSLTYHHYWNSQDYGEVQIGEEGLDELNSFEEITGDLVNLSAHFGMTLLDTPKWSIEGQLSVGVSKIGHQVRNSHVDTLEYEMYTSFSSPSAGFSFNFWYHFDPQWGFALQPSLFYSFGTAKSITDNVLPEISYFVENRKNDVSVLYPRINTMVSYSKKGLTVYAGPGFYYFYQTHSYIINRTNPDNGDTYRTDIQSGMDCISFIDGCLIIDWLIVPELTVSLWAGVGKDLYIRGGFNYNF